MIHSELRALYSYWDKVRAGRKTPLRSDIDPRDMACDARNLFILETLGRGNIRFRLAGTAIVDAFGTELRGISAAKIMTPASRERFAVLIAEALEGPGTGYARLRDAADEARIWEINLLPLRSDFGSIDRVIGCLHPLSGVPARQGGRPLCFRIEEMKVEPIGAAVRDVELAERSAEQSGEHSAEHSAGLAESPRPFMAQSAEGAGAPPPRLTPIDGGGQDQDGRRSERRRDHLRLVKK